MIIYLGVSADFFRAELGDSLWMHQILQSLGLWIVSMKDSIINAFTREHQLRVVIATVASGMGTDCPDVRHISVPDDVESYIIITDRSCW